MKALSRIFAAAAILLSDAMCADTAYAWCNLKWGGQYAGCSAPPNTALFLLIPYGAGILLCILLSLLCRKKAKK